MVRDVQTPWTGLMILAYSLYKKADQRADARVPDIVSMKLIRKNAGVFEGVKIRIIHISGMGLRERVQYSRWGCTL